MTYLFPSATNVFCPYNVCPGGTTAEGRAIWLPFRSTGLRKHRYGERAAACYVSQLIVRSIRGATRNNVVGIREGTTVT